MTTAIKFIQDHGIDRARDIVNGAPESGQPLYFNMVNSVYFFTGHRNRYFVEGVWGNEDDHPSMHEYDIKAVSITQLKRLAESVDIIKDLDGIDGAKKTLAELIKLDWNEFEHRWIDNWVCTKSRLEQAIADYEEIYPK